VNRRFDLRFKSDQIIYIDDYAHHPEELKACIASVRELYPGKKVTGIFQPHLYTRTRDFYIEFAKSLDALDEIVLLDIYPAREEELPGIRSEIILEEMENSHARVMSKREAMDYIGSLETDLLLTLGAGDIDQLVQPIEEALQAREQKQQT
jgi:UDP-N-acetylmuramate--alanine ligase